MQLRKLHNINSITFFGADVSFKLKLPFVVDGKTLKS
ncbi:hypothetical protein DFQ09_10319 [Winogradskyella pacifica]|uniref:Uncharacterized protein n=1 Tax=Winogradskyella pacifica TaxID=664642 RepID=A0A3D9MZN1_9FLAO|nr:hypothetical protein DFQ09_10319 [Winogradskyella pacifica]